MRRSVAVAVLLALLLVPVIADEEAAQFFTARGREALANQKFKAAKEHFEKALSEQDGFLPARVGFAEALAGLGEKEEAVRLLTRCLEREAEPGLTGENLEAVKRARTRLLDLDPLGLDYLLLIRNFQKQVLALAEEHREKDPDLAQFSLERLLLVDPECMAARKFLHELKASAGTAQAETGRRELFDGKSLEGWTAGSAWTVLAGRLVGRAGDGERIIWSDRGASGNFAAEFEMRTAEEASSTSTPTAVIGVGFTSTSRRYNIVILPDSVSLEFEDGEQRSELRMAQLPDAFSSRKWSTYRLVVKGKKLTVLVNGSPVLSHQASDPGTFDGAVFMMAQHLTIEVRRVTLFD